MILLHLWKSACVIGTPLLKQYLKKRVRRRKEDPKRITERYGLPSIARPDGKLLWCHAASVGESLCALPLIKQFLEENPAWSILVTTGTITSAKLMKERLPEKAFHQYLPSDHPKWINRFLDYWEPNICWWLESELWPTTLSSIKERDIPCLLLNARLSDASFKKWKKYQFISKYLFSLFKVILTQNIEQYERFTTLHKGAVINVGNLKYDTPPPPDDAKKRTSLEKRIGDRPCWITASIHPGEESILAEAHQQLKQHYPNLLTIIVPRHPQKAPQLAAPFEQVSYRSKKESLTPDTDVYMADTMGELGIFYRLADVAFVGGSLISHGGQNPLEPSFLKKPVVFGQHMENFREIAASLLESGGASQINDAITLVNAVATYLENPVPFGEKTYIAATAETGAIKKILAITEEYMA